MHDALLARLLSAPDMQTLNALIAADPFIFDPENWVPFDHPSVQATAVEALAVAVQDALKSVIRKRCKEVGLDEAKLAAEPSAVRSALYSEAAGWTTYAAIGDVAKAVRLAADGDRFATNLILSDEGLSALPAMAPGTLAFCGPGSVMLYAFKNNLGFWQIVLFRLQQEDGSVGCCQIETATNTVLAFHPNATRVQKLFQYDLPVGGRSVIAKDLLDLLQQTIHDSIIPFSLQDQAGRYGLDRFLSKASLGLDFKLRHSQKKQLTYLHSDTLNGKTVNIYLFKLRFERQHEQTTRHTLNHLYFKSDRHVVFLRQGMVVGDLGADFIEYAAGFRHLRNHLLVSVSEVMEGEIEGLKTMLSAYLSGDAELQRQNSIYNEELPIG